MSFYFLEEKNQAPWFFGHHSGQNLSMLDDALFFFFFELGSLSFFKKKGRAIRLDFVGPLVMGQVLGLTSFFSFFFFFNSFDFFFNFEFFYIF
jgi:hypothetical protein